jgi:hypothetical protein
MCHQTFRTDKKIDGTQRHAIPNHAVETASEMNTTSVSQAKLHTCSSLINRMNAKHVHIPKEKP